jgi:hypothetical protein
MRLLPLFGELLSGINGSHRYQVMQSSSGVVWLCDLLQAPEGGGFYFSSTSGKTIRCEYV